MAEATKTVESTALGLQRQAKEEQQQLKEANLTLAEANKALKKENLLRISALDGRVKAGIEEKTQNSKRSYRKLKRNYGKQGQKMQR